jgi:hypothetical protein
MTQRILLYAIEQDFVIGIGGVLERHARKTTITISVHYDLGPAATARRHRPESRRLRRHGFSQSTATPVLA